MNRRLPRALWPLVLLLAIMAWRSAGCRGKKDVKAKTTTPGASAPPHWITPLMTAPPPRPTVTMWKGVTRAPVLPE